MLSLGQKKPRGGDPLEVTKAQGEFCTCFQVWPRKLLLWVYVTRSPKPQEAKPGGLGLSLLLGLSIAPGEAKGAGGHSEAGASRSLIGQGKEHRRERTWGPRVQFTPYRKGDRALCSPSLAKFSKLKSPNCHFPIYTSNHSHPLTTRLLWFPFNTTLAPVPWQVVLAFLALGTATCLLTPLA